MSFGLSAYQGKTALVTGGAGAVGSNLVEALCEQGCAKVSILDNLSASNLRVDPAGKPVEFVEGDITDEAALKRVFLQPPDFVFHLAAFFANQNSIENPETDLRVNGLGTLRVLQYAQMARVKRFVYASSSASFYDELAPLPITEDYTTLHQTTPYKATKMLGELYCNFFQHQYGLPTVKTRFFNSYGPGEMPGKYRNVIPNFVDRALRGLPLVITGSGKETRDFTYVGDLVEGVLRAGIADGAEGEAFNLASGRETRILDLAKMINRLTENSAGVQFADRRHWDTQLRRWASITKAENSLGYQPATALEDGLEKTIRWFERNRETLSALSPETRKVSAVRSVPVTTRDVAAESVPILVGSKGPNGNGTNGRH